MFPYSRLLLCLELKELPLELSIFLQIFLYIFRSQEGEETGGNRILITMSPHLASPPPTPPQGQLRRWGPLSSTPNSNSRLSNAPKAPAPPKTNSFNAPPGPPMPHQINEARSRLRSTGRTLDEIDSSRDIYAGRVRDESYNFSVNSVGSGGPFTPPMSPTSPKSFGTNYSNGRHQPSEVRREPVHISTVGRSQSFHSSAMESSNEPRNTHADYSSQTWKPQRSHSPEPAAPPRQPKTRPLSGLFSTLQSSKKKANRAAKIFDSSWLGKVDNDKADRPKTRKSKKDAEKWDEDSKSTRYSREKENNRPHSAMESGYDHDRNGSTHFSVKMAGKYSQHPTTNGFSGSLSSEAPVPPPRTKRRQRPQTTYYFGEQPESFSTSSKPRPNSIYANVSYGRDTPTKTDYNSRDSYGYSNNRTKMNSSNSRSYENEYNSNDYDRKNLSNGSRNDTYSKTKYSEVEMNRRNDRFNTRADSRQSNGRDHSNDRYDSGYGGRQYDRYDDSYGRKSTDSRRHQEKSNRRTSEERRHGSRKTSKEERGSPTVERRYKTTKTITPVFVMETKQPKQYRSMDVLNSSPERNSPSWTQTLETRRKSTADNRMSSTLPRKVHQTKFTLPSKTYVYGHTDRNDHDRYSGGSMLNVNSDHNTSHDQYNGVSSTNVLRSQSLNVRPAANLSSLRSPNLIASIARSNSTRRPETQSSENLLSSEAYERTETDPTYPRRYQVNGQSDEKKSRFMEGLLNTAPELFHFMHGPGEDTVDKRTVDSPPRLVRPDSSSPSPSANPPKVFTFGRDGSNTLRRGSSGSGHDLNSSTPNLTKTYTNGLSRPSSGYDSGTYSNNSIKRNGSNAQDGNRRQSTFNMKTEGGSLLYSPSFRERSQQMIQKKMQQQQEAKMAASKRASISDQSPILIQVRDWNER